MADMKEAMYQFLELQQSRDSSAFDSDDSNEDDGYIDILQSSTGERTSTAWVESKQHRVLRQSVSDEMSSADPSYRPDNAAANDDDTMDWHDDEEDAEDSAFDDVPADDSSETADDSSASPTSQASVNRDNSERDNEFQVEINTTYSGQYHGAAVFPDGDDHKIEVYSERAAGVILKQPLGMAESRKCHITVTNTKVSLSRTASIGIKRKSRAPVELELSTLRCFSLHRDRHMKPKFVSIMALRNAAQRKQHPHKPYACYLIHFAKTADAASFMTVMKYVCKQQLIKKLEAVQEPTH
eukprot:m.27069 g.27069  ORF g.27069 m.27069 type:complete len:297 (+) comp11747_c0_seq1:78-968(+)